MTEQTSAPAPEAPKPGSPEYIEAMASKYRESKGVAPRPDHVPEKFYDPETGQVRVDDLLKSYVELEKMRGTAPAAQPASQATEAAPAAAETAPADDAALDDLVKTAGLDPDALALKIVKDGALAPADYDALAKVGVPKAFVDAYVQMAKSTADTLATKRSSDAEELFGGKEQAQVALNWARDNLPEVDKARLNQMLAGPNWADAVTIIQSKRAAATGTGREPSLVDAGTPGAGTVSGYTTKAQMQADMAKPEYQSNPSFRAQVRAKVAAASKAGWPDDRDDR